jgi:hypothetical protein
MVGTTAFALIMFLQDRLEPLATYPTQEACMVVARTVRDQLRETPNQTTVGIACVPTNQITAQDVEQQMRALMRVIRDFDQDTGRIEPCAAK